MTHAARTSVPDVLLEVLIATGNDRQFALGAASVLEASAEWADELGERLGDRIGLALADAGIDADGIDEQLGAQVAIVRRAAVELAAELAEDFRGEALLQAACASGLLTAQRTLAARLGYGQGLPGSPGGLASTELLGAVHDAERPTTVQPRGEAADAA
jgi:hypothetical protein